MKKIAQTVDLLISHSQIQFRSRTFDETSSQWDKVNLEQQCAIIHSNYVVFDPISEEAFGANAHLKLEDSFDPTTQRCIAVPLHVTDSHHVENCILC
ncbi:competence protein ComJ [Pseudomonas frederiksbergensis]|uniref:competence protein ComJ n=1 Tax=Pseudomonas frederiksbergensis TaxID=104087 RepID=UPI000F46AFBB|nr:competence protein ComJ [Pseudomonas frederiksbergensis]